MVISLKIGLSVIDDTINGFLKPVNKQVKNLNNIKFLICMICLIHVYIKVEKVCKDLAENPDLKDGYHAIGFSQVMCTVTET